MKRWVPSRMRIRKRKVTPTASSIRALPEVQRAPAGHRDYAESVRRPLRVPASTVAGTILFVLPRCQAPPSAGVYLANEGTYWQACSNMARTFSSGTVGLDVVAVGEDVAAPFAPGSRSAPRPCAARRPRSRAARCSGNPSRPRRPSGPRYVRFKSAGCIPAACGWTGFRPSTPNLDQVVDDGGHRAAGMEDHLGGGQILDLPKEALLPRLDVPEVVLAAHQEGVLGPQIVRGEHHVHRTTDRLELPLGDGQVDLQDGVEEDAQPLGVRHEVAEPVLEAAQVLADVDEGGRGAPGSWRPACGSGPTPRARPAPPRTRGRRGRARDTSGCRRCRSLRSGANPPGRSNSSPRAGPRSTPHMSR